jgi:hypothetical protein
MGGCVMRAKCQIGKTTRRRSVNQLMVALISGKMIRSRQYCKRCLPHDL